MDARRWERAQELFHQASEIQPRSRQAFLEAATNDPALIEEVLALLAEDANTGQLLDRGVAPLAGALLQNGDHGPPATFGPWRLKSLLGEGGMGVVYLAERADLGSVAAIKFLRDAALSPARRERFANEQRTLAQLNHPGIAHLYDAEVLPDGTPWFTMEYVDGTPLTAYCDAHHRDVEARLRLFRSVCEAVQYAHRHTVIHRDLKPSNILVTGEGAVKLLDFGIAKHLDPEDRPVDQTRTGLRLFTPAYAAPEQVRGEAVGTYTDIYSLGVILYQLLSGRLPFDLSHATPNEALSIVAEREPLRPSAAFAAAPVDGRKAPSRAAWTDLDVLCLTAMHKDPQRRYRTVEALIRDIDHFLAREPLDARPDSVGYRVGKFVRRNRVAMVAASLAVLVLLGTVVFYTLRLRNARNQALDEAARTQRIQKFTESLFQGGDALVGPSDSLRVVTLLERGVLEARSLAAEPAVQADLFATLGDIYRKLGQVERADTLLRKALDQRTLHFGEDNLPVAESQVALGLLRMDQAEYPEAEQLIRTGLDRSRRLQPDHPLVAKATTALGLVLQEKGAYDEAIAVLEEAVRLRSATQDTTTELEEAMSALAGAHFYAGHLDLSDSLNMIVLGMSRRLHGERHPMVAEDLINLGAAEFQRGKYGEAEQYYRQALEISTAWYGEEHPTTAGHLTGLGRALVFQNRFDEATLVLEKALAVQERVYGPVHPRVASALNELSNTAIQQERYDEAEKILLRMEAIYRQLYDDGHYLVALAMANRAHAYMSAARYREAEPIFRDVIQRYSKAQGPEHINTGIARIKLGRVLLRQGKFAEAENQSLAGYDILIKQADPAVSFLRAARTDLAIAYDSLGAPEKAAKFRAELDAAAKKR